MRVRWFGTCLVAAALLAAAAIAQEKSTAEKGKKAAGPPDEKAMMEAMQKAATPGDAHKKLDAVVGTFDAKVKMWMDPSKPAEESAGTSENKWVLGNRYVEMQYQGTFMGGPFSGIGYMGYDNVTKKYVGSWMDTGGTGIVMSTGAMNAAGKTMIMSGSEADPATGKMEKFEEKITVADNDHHTMEWWGMGPDGKLHKMMEIDYTRKP